jgi:HSP20 family protein
VLLRPAERRQGVRGASDTNDCSVRKHGCANRRKVMMTLWNAFDDRFFDDFWRTAGRVPTRGTEFEPPVDVVEQENAYELRIELPGIKPEEVDVSVDGNTLTVRGERNISDEQRKKDGYYRLERRYGKFQRTFTLPQTVDAGSIGADLSNGMLTLTLPKKELAKPRKIAVSGSSSLTEKAKKLFTKGEQATPSA